MTRPATSRLKVNPPLGSLPVLQYCAPDQLLVDSSYQRSMETGPSQALIRRIAMHWDWGLCQPLIVARRADGGLYVVDGQHRHAAAKLREDIWQLPCVVVSYATAADEAASFVALNQQRRPLNQLDLFKAALAAGDSEAVAIVKAIEGASLTLAGTTNNQAMRAGAVGNIGGLQRCFRQHGELVLQTSLKVLARAYPDETLRFAGSIFPGLAIVVIDELRKRAAATELVEAFGQHVAATPQAEWFKRIQAAIADDPNLKRSRAAEQVFRASWAERQLQLEMGGGTGNRPAATFLKPAELAWCEQCDQRVSGAHAARCISPFCKLKQADAA